MNRYKLTLIACLMVMFQHVQAMKPGEVEFKDLAKEREKSREEKEVQDKKNKDLQAQHQAQVEELANKEMQFKSNESDVVTKLKESSQRPSPLDTTFSLYDESKIKEQKEQEDRQVQDDLAIQQKSIKTFQDLQDYVSYLFRKLGEVIDSFMGNGLPENVDSALDMVKHDLRALNEKIKSGQAHPDNVKKVLDEVLVEFARVLKSNNIDLSNEYVQKITTILNKENQNLFLDTYTSVDNSQKSYDSPVLKDLKNERTLFMTEKFESPNFIQED